LLVKNSILTREKSFIRKAKEIILSYQIEQRFTKDQILKLYFNEIPYGSNNYGIEAASQAYFNKHAKDLDLAESALLAAIVKAPTY
jgi:membrane peptidoglycan carboxypeptidase